MYTHVMVGTDGSETATRAVQAAARLAHAHGARLTIVHAFQPRRGPSAHEARAHADELGWLLTPGGAAESLAHEAAELARGASCGAVEVDALAEPGEPIAVLLEAVERGRPDAVVVGNADLRRVRLRRAIGPALSRRAGVDVVIVDTTTTRPTALAS